MPWAPVRPRLPALIPRPPPGYLHSQEGRPGLPRSRERRLRPLGWAGTLPGGDKVQGRQGAPPGTRVHGTGTGGRAGGRPGVPISDPNPCWVCSVGSRTHLLGSTERSQAGPIISLTRGGGPRSVLVEDKRRESPLPSEARGGGRALPSSRPRRKEGFSWLLHATRCLSLTARAVHTGSRLKIPENNKEEN